jgi:hypothetical protein
MAQILLDTKDENKVRRVRRLIRRWFGPDAEMVFGEASDNVLAHTDHKCANISVHARRFRVVSTGAPLTSEGLTKFIHNEDRQGGYGLLIMSALGGDLTMTDDKTRIDWYREECSSAV